MLYPEIYYKVQPYILSACDEMNSFGSSMPTKKAISVMSDRVYAEIMREHPELAVYEREGSGTGAAVHGEATAMQNRGLFRDFLDVLLIYELFGRRRW